MKNKMTMLTLCLSFLLSACEGPGVKAYYRCNEAYKRGQYEMSFANYLYAANLDVVPAKYNLGYQYFYGQGTKQNQTEAIRLFKSIQKHSIRATYALHLIDEKASSQPWTFQLKSPVSS